MAAGGWIPTAPRGYDRYAEQLWLTLFAKSGSAGGAVRLEQHHAAAGHARHRAVRRAETAAAAAERAFDAVDPVLGKLGKPVALRSYKPFHSRGRGSPAELPRHDRAADGDRAALSGRGCRGAAHRGGGRRCANIVEKIEKHVRAGKSVVITSGLLRALQPRGIGQYRGDRSVSNRVALVSQFLGRSRRRGELRTSRC